MKKWIAILLACTLLFAFGCKKEEAPVTTPEPTPAAPPAETPEPTPEPTPSEEVEENFVYTSTLYGFTITMPKEWETCCLIEENDMQVTFYSAANRYMDYEGELYDCGKLFTIMIPEDDQKQGDGYVFPDYDIIGQYNGADILVLYPTDVQIADFEDEDAVEEFSSMSQAVPSVIETITFG